MRRCTKRVVHESFSFNILLIQSLAYSDLYIARLNWCLLMGLGLTNKAKDRTNKLSNKLLAAPL